ncbi:MAG: tyrosine--tRNA ligase [Anaerolineae bacterium]|nr:tyrosine--tRNA ligase [Anaerolineae bacterium]
MNIKDQIATLMQGTEYGDDELKMAMQKELHERLAAAEKEKRPLRVYAGFDPRTTDLHLGHTIPMGKLRQFQELGHEVTFVVGTYTSLIGDPSDQDQLRQQLTPAQAEENAQTYAKQAFRVLDPEKTIVRYNAEWLADLNFADLIRFASNFTIQQFLTRENFKLRFEKGDAIYLHETFYSIMQAYDAHILRADVQVGGSDQLFNIITAGRKLMNALGGKPNVGIIMGILPGTDGVIRMSKSLGNHIPLNTDAGDMYGKVMSLPDAVMPQYFRMVTRWTAPEIAQMEAEMDGGKLHPRDAKMKLAREVTARFYDDSAADAAQGEFVKVFQMGNVPEEMLEYKLEGEPKLVEVLVDSGLVASKSEGRRMVKQRGVRLDGNTLEEPDAPIPSGEVLQLGKRRFLKLIR